MTLHQVLDTYGFDCSKSVKLVRHRDVNFDLNKMYKQGLLEYYQNIQGNDVFGDCDYIISFIADGGSRSIFIGVYQIMGKSIPSVCPHPYFEQNEMWKAGRYYYDMRKTEYLADLKDRLVIDWGKATRSWYQLLRRDRQKSVIEIYPSGYVLDFPGFDSVMVDYHDLQRIVSNPAANRIWHTMLRSVAGVYLILDKTDGKQYIGSAYGEDGILGRWKTYSENGHGGNKKLKDLPQENYDNFQFSILRTLPKTMTMKEVIALENAYKKKLGSIAYGLNKN